MSNEDGKFSSGSLIEKECLLAEKKNKLGIDDLPDAIARMAVAQICESLGFQSFHQSALNTLSYVGVRYIREVGRNANFYANLTNRTEGNVLDVIKGLEDLGYIQRFSGGSDSGHCLSGSAVVRDIIRYIGEAEEVPFVYSIPQFPVVKERKLNPGFEQTGESPRQEHIPDWLPKFPVPGTCKDLKPGNEEELQKEINNITQHVERQNKKFEMPLINVQQKLICNGFEEGVAIEPGDVAKSRKAAESNLFVASPLQIQEKELSLPVLPAKLYDETAGGHKNHMVRDNHIYAIGQSLHTTEAVWSSLCESRGDGKNILLNGRPTLQFQFKSSRKSLGMPIGLQTTDTEKIAVWFGDNNDDHEKDDKRRMTKQILSGNGENLQEIAHL